MPLLPSRWSSRNTSLLCAGVLATLPARASAYATTHYTDWFHGYTQFYALECRRIAASGVNAHCGSVANCVLERMDEWDKAQLTSSQVVGGVLPALLSSLGNKVSEISLVGSEHPLLAIFLAVGEPSSYQTRITEYANPMEDMRRVSFAPAWIMQMRSGGKVTMGWAVAAQYALAMAAAVNNIEIALRLGSRGILIWGCDSWYDPLIWILFPVGTYVFAALSCYTRDRRKDDGRGGGGCCCCVTVFHAALQGFQRACGMRPLVEGGEPSTAAIFLQVVASTLAYIDIILGTGVLASLLFVGFVDILIILARLVASAVACNWVVTCQLLLLKADLGL